MNSINANSNNNLKVARPTVNITEGPALIPHQKLFSEDDANIKMHNINADIYRNVSKEKSNQAFSFSLFMKIFLGIGLITLFTKNYSKVKSFFHKY